MIFLCDIWLQSSRAHNCWVALCYRAAARSGTLLCLRKLGTSTLDVLNTRGRANCAQKRFAFGGLMFAVSSSLFLQLPGIATQAKS
jgi:hypothetical protein